jgi:hypothetical protein
MLPLNKVFAGSKVLPERVASYGQSNSIFFGHFFLFFSYFAFHIPRNSSDYVSVQHLDAHPAAENSCSSVPVLAQSTVQDQLDGASKAAAVNAFHMVIRSTSRCYSFDDHARVYNI